MAFNRAIAAVALLSGVALPALAAAEPDQRDDVIVIGEREQTDAATKTDTPIVETPQSISVIPADRFLAMGALTLQDTLRYTAGVRTEAYGLDTRGDYGFIRGTEPAIYQDGLRRLFGGYRTGSKQEIFTLDRVEVMRGPSSMLYGQAPTGGLINTVTKTPSFTPAATIFGSYGTFDRIEGGVDLTGPIAGDMLAARIVAVVRDSDSQTRLVGERRVTVNPSVTFSPGADTTLTVLGLIQDDDSGWTGQFLPYAATIFGDTAANGRLPWNAQLGEPSIDRVDLNTKNVTAVLSHRFSDAARFRQNFRYEWFKSDQFLHYANLYANPTDPFVLADDAYLAQFFPALAALGGGRVLNRFAFGENLRSETLTSDSQLQLDFDTGSLRHKLLAGVDYVNYRQRSRSAFGSSFNGYDADGVAIAPTATPIDAYAPTFGNVIPLAYADDPSSQEEQLGFYLQDQIKAFDRATIVLGLRRDRAESSSSIGTRFVDTAWTTRVGLLYDLGGGLVPYVSYSESFQPVAGTDFSGNPYRPTRGRQYEGGVKWQPDAGTLVTATVYDLRDTGRLLADPANPLNQVQAGTIETQGVEFEAQRTIARDFDVIASYSYTRAQDKSVVVGDGVDSNQVDSIPRHLASIWGMKNVAVRGETMLRIGAGARYVGESRSTSFDANFANFTLTTPGYVAFDALLGVDHGRWTAALNAANLFDKRYYTTCLGRGDCFLGMRRTVNLRVGYRF